MDAPSSTTPSAPKPTSALDDLLTAWPRSAQAAMAFLLGVCLTLLAIHCYSMSRWSTRPTEPITLVYRVDLNRADRAELLQLPGVGDKLATRIEEYRQEHGGFRDVDELVKVHGVGPARVEKLRSWVKAAEDGAKPDDVPTSKKPPAKGKKEASLSEPINVNTASADELQRLPGIGPHKARCILDERAKKPFATVDELRRVSGIGAKTLEKLRPYVAVQRDGERVAARAE